jgi:hypothetical protein
LEVGMFAEQHWQMQMTRLRSAKKNMALVNHVGTLSQLERYKDTRKSARTRQK